MNLERFAMLLVLSTIIATFGMLGDSTATVIGAMIIAPLMTPIMATAAGLVMGDMERAGHSFLVVVAGAFAMSRDDVADSLPGVANPPMCPIPRPDRPTLHGQSRPES